MLNAKERKRLADLLGMTASGHDGEALNAMRMAHAFLHERGLTIREVVNGRHLDLAPVLAFLLKQLAVERAKVAGLQQALEQKTAAPDKRTGRCQHCGQPFVPKNHGRVPKYCSVACRQAANCAGCASKKRPGWAAFYTNHSI